MTKTRLVVCFDGTWNTPDSGAKPTNVTRMVRAIPPEDGQGTRQLVFYDKGVGTGGGRLDRAFAGATGKGLTENVIDGYRFVANNHTGDDEIYIFGFSRGAYTARSLAGLIGLAGLLTPHQLGADLSKVLEIYRNRNLESDGKHAQVDAMNLPGRRRDVPIACVGVWDTVGSLGIPTDFARRLSVVQKYHFHDVQLGKQIRVGLHAVAIDEKRAAFSPTLWVSETGEPHDKEQKVEQVWFAGAHSNVGGSYPDSGLSDIAFDWMCKRVTKLTGLVLDFTPYTEAEPGDFGAPDIDSRSLFYKGSVVYPYERIINREIPSYGGFLAWFRQRFRSLDRRNIPPDNLRTVNEMLHVSVLQRWGLDGVPHDCKDPDHCESVPYRPVNLAEVVRAHHDSDRRPPVVGWNGEPMTADAPWPGRDTLPG